MKASNYGVMGSSSYDPKQFVLKALKKIQLNNKNAMKFFESNDTEGIKERMINSIHLLEELDLMLNREVENPTVDRVSMHYQWLMEVFEEILTNLEEGTIKRERFDEIIETSDIVVNNLYEGFAGMRD